MNKSEASATPKTKFCCLVSFTGEEKQPFKEVLANDDLFNRVLTDLRGWEDPCGSNRPVAHREQLLGFSTDLQMSTAMQKPDIYFQMYIHLAAKKVGRKAL